MGPIWLQWDSFRTLVALFGGLQGTCGTFLTGFDVFCMFLNVCKLFEQALRNDGKRNEVYGMEWTVDLEE